MVDICRTCTGMRHPSSATACISLDCPFFFDRCKALRATQHAFTVLADAGLLASAPATIVLTDDDDDDDAIAGDE